MKTKVLATALASLSCGLAITIVSCNNNGGIADAPNNPTHGGKSSQVLSGNCDATLAVNRCGTGAAQPNYDVETGSLTVNGMNRLSDGLSSTFAPAHTWQQAVDATIPEEGGKQLSAIAYNAGAMESRLDIARDQPDITQLGIRPQFLAGDGNFTIEVYNDGQRVASTPVLNPGSGPTVAAMGRFWTWVKFHVHVGPRAMVAPVGGGDDQSGACEWVLTNDRGPAAMFTLPDGQQARGNEIRFREDVDGSGRYPYHSTDQIDVTGNIGSYTVISESAGS